MTGENPDYKKMYDELKTQFESLQTKLTETEKGITDRETKITELKTYIADNIISKPNDDNKNGLPETKSFDSVYLDTLAKMEKANKEV